jgi:hypothetical protein
MIIHDVEQGTPEWHALRAGIPTASEFKKLVTTKGEPSKSMPEYAIQLAADKYAGEPLDAWQGNEWTERGKEMEDRGRAYYENTFADRSVSQVGFITDDELTHGASPDSLVDDDGMLEIKCLKASRHVGVLVFYERNGRLPADYILQPQGQMLVAQREWCDSLFWHPELPALLVRNKPDEKIVVNLRLQIASCLQERDKIMELLNRA